VILSEIPRRNAGKYPNKLALVYKDKGLTYKEFNERVNRTANGLLSLGLKRGDIIAVLSDHCFPFFEIQWACFKTGVIWQEINPLSIQPAEGVAFQLNNTGAKVLFVKEKIASPVATFKGIEMVDSIRPRLKEVRRYISFGTPMDYMESYDEWVSKSPSTEPPGVEQSKLDDLIFLLASSGTTGFPKQAMLTYSNLWHCYLATAQCIGVTPDIIEYNSETPYVSTTSFTTNTFLYKGCTVYLSNAQEPKERLEEIKKYKPNYIIFYCPMVPDIINFPEAEKYNPGTVRLVWSSGGVPLAHYAKRIEEIFGCKYVCGYCSVEQTPITWAKPADYEFMDLTKGILAQGVSSPFSHLKVVNEQGEEVDIYEIGEIIATGGQRFQGYWNDPKKTEETIKGDWVYTGDIGLIDENGYLYVYGRKKDAIVIGGKMVPPTQVDAVVDLHPAVAECTTIGVPHKELGNAVKSVVVLKEGERVTAKELMDFCRERLPSHAVPKSIVFADSLPKGLKGIPKIVEIQERWGKEL